MDRLLDPFIRTAITENIEQLKTEYPLVVADIPLLYEGHYEQLMDAVAVVYLPENIQIQRLMKRNHLSLEEAKQRVSSQLSIEEKKHSLISFLIIVGVKRCSKHRSKTG